MSILSDDIVEQEEDFIVSLSSSDVAVVFNQSNASVLIVDSDEGRAC